MDPKSFESAVAFLMRRARVARPSRVADPPQDVIRSSSSSSSALPNGAPDFRGKPPIQGMQGWLQQLGYSQAQLDRLNAIHVAGTKGKGSTCAFVESFLRCRGLKTGLYTSPHLLQLNDRIRVNFDPLSPELFAKYVFDVRDRLSLNNDSSTDSSSSSSSSDGGGGGPRYLQLLALTAFHAFLQEQVDVAIFETHHGGEFDATNVLQRPVVTAITSIGIDHIVDLGPTVENIAWHKAGIFKPGVPAISAPQEPSVAKVLRDRASEKDVTLDFVAAVKEDEEDDDPQLPAGAFPSNVQRLNCSLARAICDKFLAAQRCHQKGGGRGGRGLTYLSDQEIAAGVAQFSWPGRFQRIQDTYHRHCIWYLDGAHNEISIIEAVRWFQRASQHEYLPSSTVRVLIFAQISHNRDGESILQRLLQILPHSFQHVILTTYRETEDDAQTNNHEEKLVLARYQQILSDVRPHVSVSVAMSIDKAISTAREFTKPTENTQVFVTGSLYLVGSVLRLGFTKAG